MTATGAWYRPACNVRRPGGCSRGFRTADLFCLRENRVLLRLVSGTGARIHHEDGEVHVEIELDRMLDQVRPLDPLRPAA